MTDARISPFQWGGTGAKFGSMKPNNVVAIYRVSSKKQLENESIPRQREETRSYCTKRGQVILEEFVLAETASKVKERHEFEKIIQYCMVHHRKIAAVVIWKVSRFTRGGMDVYYMLKALLAQKGIRIESATENIDDTPMGEWAEGMLAVQARFDSRQRTDITIGAEKRLVQRGFWCRSAPTGFENAKVLMYDEESGMMKKRPILLPIRDQRQWELLQYGLHKQITGMYKIGEVAEELRKKGFVTKNLKPITPQTWLKICRNPVYGGWKCEKWTNYELIRAQFDGAISREEWIELQKALDGKGKKGVKLPRKKFNPDFPLRQFLCCPKCGKRATGAPSVGKMGKKYCYYGCGDRKNCKWGVRTETAHELFLKLLQALKPSDESLAVFGRIVVEKWKTKYKELNADAIATAKKVTELKERKANLFRLIENSSDESALFADMKKEYEQISQEILFATTERQEKEIDEYDAETVLNHCTYFMANAHELWEKAPVEEKFRFQSLIFPDGISFDVLEGKRTPKISLIYEVIKELQMPHDPLAAPRRVELRLTD